MEGRRPAVATAARAPTPRDRAEYLLFRVLVTAVRWLPEAVANAAGSCLGWVAGVVLRIRRRVVDENLARAFPDRSERDRRRIALASYRHVGREAVALFRSAYESADAVRRRTEVEGMEAVREAIARGEPCLLLTGHLGNWEIAGSAMAVRGVPVDGIARRQRNPLFDRELVRTRERLGMRIIRRRDAPHEIRRSLREGRVPGFVADQDAGRRGVFVDFFGTPASTARGAAYFAVRTGARLFAGAALREGTGTPARYRVIVEEVTAERTGDLTQDVRRLTEAHTQALERWVRAAPEQYFWLHKRWKSLPPATAF